MNRVGLAGAYAGTGDAGRVESDDVFEVLANRRRRYVLHYLRQQQRPVDLRELSTQVAAWENGVPVADVSRQQRKRVYTALRQTHLPTMDAAGVLVYDHGRGVATPAPGAADVAASLELVVGGRRPWDDYYLALGLLSCAAVVGAWTVPTPPFTLLSGLGWAAAIAGLLAASAFVHAYDVRRPRVGGDGPPPELRDG